MASNFILRGDARDWFRKIPVQSKAPVFEAYYFCAIAGLTFRVKSEVPQGAQPFLAHLHFPDEFTGHGSLLVGLLLSSEMSIAGIDPADRKGVHLIVSKVVAPEGQTGLSDYGVGLLNEYASGGFGEILTRMGDGASSYPTFMKEYRDMLNLSQS
jgi:hypothetical protein